MRFAATNSLTRTVICFLVLLLAASRALAQESSSHAELMTNWNKDSFDRGHALYHSICITCHGTPEKEGSLPTSRAFWKEPFKNGTDPFNLFKTLTDGLGQMPAWPSVTPRERYDVIHYLSQAFLKQTIHPAYLQITDA